MRMICLCNTMNFAVTKRNVMDEILRGAASPVSGSKWMSAFRLEFSECALVLQLDAK